MRAERAYEELIGLLREETLLDSSISLLEWDQETCMPAGGSRNRSEQLALLAGLLHDRATDPRIGELLDALEGSSLVADPDSPAAVNVREIRRIYQREGKLPRALVEEVARTTSLAHRAWAPARASADFAAFRPWLERVLALKRSEAECVGYANEAYDALIDDHEPGVTAAEFAGHADAIRQALVPLVAAIAESGRRAPTAILRREYPVDRQRVFCQTLAAAVGFDFERGRLDTSAHPFCTGIGPGDCRITTRYNQRYLSGAVFTVLHEVGHALYEQGLDPEHYGTPMGEQASVAIDESQARLWENLVGRRHAFWRHFLPLARNVFGDALQDVSVDDFHFAVNHVEASLVRREADQVTYGLHILIRFELERALVGGKLAVADLPDAWRDAYRRHLGVTPADDREGCLQDGHWAEGLFGYFPTYTLGDIIGAQLVARADQELGGLDRLVARGEFAPLVAWLHDRVYRHGQRYRSAALVERATGSPLDHRPLLDLLRRKYGELYRLP
jgi:carboxypeptidase Taq